MIEIQLTASEELLSAIRGLASLFRSGTGATPLAQKTPESIPEAEKQPLPEENPAPKAASSLTLEEVRAIVSQAARKDKAGCFAILEGYGVKNLSKLPAEHYPEFLSRIENEILKKDE